MSDFIEEKIIGAVKGLLAGRVNELLEEFEFAIAPIEFNAHVRPGAAEPVLRLAECEKSEKDRIVKLDAYTLTAALYVPEGPDSERDVYAYGAAIGRAVARDCTLAGVADRAVIVGKKYTPPKHPHCGEDWELLLSFRVTVEAPFGLPGFGF